MKSPEGFVRVGSRRLWLVLQRQQCLQLVARFSL